VTARFLDATFLLMLLIPSEPEHGTAVRLFNEMKGYRLFTSDGVIYEVLAHISKWDPQTRIDGVRLVRRLMTPGEGFEVLYPTPERIRVALDLYEQRLDQSYSLVDCLSMTLMDELGITEVLTYDKDFHGEGRFTILPPAN